MTKIDRYYSLGRLVGHEVGVDHTPGGQDILIEHSKVNRCLVFPDGRPFSARTGHLLVAQQFQMGPYAF